MILPVGVGRPMSNPEKISSLRILEKGKVIKELFTSPF